MKILLYICVHEHENFLLLLLNYKTVIYSTLAKTYRFTLLALHFMDLVTVLQKSATCKNTIETNILFYEWMRGNVKLHRKPTSLATLKSIHYFSIFQ